MICRSRQLLGFAATAVILVGCGQSEPEQVTMQVATPSRPTAPRTPPPPAVTSIAELMTELGIDRRVSLPEDLAPMTNPERKAVLEFFDSFARGDSTALRSMLTKLDRPELDELVQSGAWSETTVGIDQIDVETGTSPDDGLACALAVFYVGSSFQPQLWYYTVGENGPVFEAVAAPPNMIDRLYGDDRIAQWFEILAEELALADKPDEEFIVKQQDLSDGSNRPRQTGGGPAVNPGAPPSLPGSPSKPGPSGPGRRKKGPKRAPPGPGG